MFIARPISPLDYQNLSDAGFEPFEQILKQLEQGHEELDQSPISPFVQSNTQKLTAPAKDLIEQAKACVDKHKIESLVEQMQFHQSTIKHRGN